MEEDSNDVDSPSEVEELDSDSEERPVETNISNHEEPVSKRIKSCDSENNGNNEEGKRVSSRKRSEPNMADLNRGPPHKRIKLSPDSNNRPNQDDNFEEPRDLDGEQQDEDEDVFECDVSEMSANFFSEELTSDDEILTFQCPKNFNVKLLLNKSIDLGKNVKLKDDVSKYVCHTVESSRKKKINCVFPNKEKGGVVVKLPVVGHIVLRQIMKLPKKSVGSFVDYDTKNVQLPIFDSTKRHPLLGTEWNDHLDKVRKQIRKHKRLLRRSLKHEKSLEKTERERKEQKKKLKVELALLKKKQILDIDN